MITYERKSPDLLSVKLDGKIIGAISKVEGGFRYTPKGKKVGDKWSGNILATENEVKKSLHSD